MYRFRQKNTVHLDIKVVTEALTDISKRDFEIRLKRQVHRASSVFAQCDIELVIDEPIKFIPDPNTGHDGSVVHTPVSTEDCPQENPTVEVRNLLGQQRSQSN